MKGKQKIVFELSEGLPFQTENIWADKVGDNLYKLDNVPVFTSGVALYDIVECELRTDGLVYFVRLHEDGGFYTTTIGIKDENSTAVDELLAFFQQDSRYHFTGFAKIWIAVCCPADLILPLHKFLENGRQRDVWEWGVEKMPDPTLTNANAAITKIIPAFGKKK